MTDSKHIVGPTERRPSDEEIELAVRAYLEAMRQEGDRPIEGPHGWMASYKARLITAMRAALATLPAKADAILASDGGRHEMAALITEACCFLVKEERPEPGSPTYDIISRLTDALIATGVGDIPAASDGGREMVRELVEALGQLLSWRVRKEWRTERVDDARKAARMAHAKAKEWLEGKGC